MVARIPNPLKRKERLETISKCVDPIPLFNTVYTRKSVETVACTSFASAQIFSISDSDVPQTSAQAPYLGTGLSSANEAQVIVMVTQLVRHLFHIAHSCLLTHLLEYLPQGRNSHHLVLLHGTFHHGPQGLYFCGGNHLMSVMATKMSSSLLIHQFQFLLIVQSAIRFGLDLLRAMSASAMGIGTSTQRRLNLLITSVSKQKSGESLHHLVYWHLRRVGQTHIIFEYVVCS